MNGEPWLTYAQLIRTYFPADQVRNATCIMRVETENWSSVCGSTPESCVVPVGNLSCYAGQPTQPAQAYGLYKIVDVCWDPKLAGKQSPFTTDEWNRILEPNYNVWAASVIWSIAGWRAWTTCDQCGICDVQGGPIPYPRAPLTTLNPLGEGMSPLLLLGGVALALTGLMYLEQRGV